MLGRFFRCCNTSYLESVMLKATHYLAQRIQKLEEKMMSSIADVNAALDTLGQSLSDQLTAINTELEQLASAGGASPEQLSAIVDRINTFKTGVDKTILDLRADDPATTTPPDSGSEASEQ